MLEWFEKVVDFVDMSQLTEHKNVLFSAELEVGVRRFFERPVRNLNLPQHRPIFSDADAWAIAWIWSFVDKIIPFKPRIIEISSFIETTEQDDAKILGVTHTIEVKPQNTSDLDELWLAIIPTDQYYWRAFVVSTKKNLELLNFEVDITQAQGYIKVTMNDLIDKIEEVLDIDAGIGYDIQVLDPPGYDHVVLDDFVVNLNNIDPPIQEYLSAIAVGSLDIEYLESPEAAFEIFDRDEYWRWRTKIEYYHDHKPIIKISPAPDYQKRIKWDSTTIWGSTIIMIAGLPSFYDIHQKLALYMCSKYEVGVKSPFEDPFLTPKVIDEILSPKLLKRTLSTNKLYKPLLKLRRN